MTVRVLDWRTRLLGWAYAINGAPFEWGKTDCASLGRAALEACFGFDVLPFMRSWTTPHGALVEVKQHGRPSKVMLRLGAKRMEIPFARAGDIVVLPESKEPIGREAVGVWLDGAILLSGREQGVHIVAHPELPEGSAAYSLWEIPDHG